MTNINVHLYFSAIIIDEVDYPSIHLLNIDNIFGDFYNLYTFSVMQYATNGVVFLFSWLHLACFKKLYCLIENALETVQ